MLENYANLKAKLNAVNAMLDFVSDVLKLTIQKNFPNEFLMKYSVLLLFLDNLVEKLFFLIEICYLYCKKKFIKLFVILGKKCE